MNAFFKNIGIFLTRKIHFFRVRKISKKNIFYKCPLIFFRKIILNILIFFIFDLWVIDPGKFPINSILWLTNLSKYHKNGKNREWMKNLENFGENRQ